MKVRNAYRYPRACVSLWRILIQDAYKLNDSANVFIRAPYAISLYLLSLVQRYKSSGDAVRASYFDLFNFFAGS
jgi:hypothetical protein